MIAHRYTLGAGERLKREQNIKALFQTGKALSFFPVRIVWLLVPRGDERFPMRAGFSAPKKKFRRAVDRARVKRLLREAWRMQKEVLAALIPEDRQIHLFILFTGPELPEYSTVFEAVGKGIKQLQKALCTAHE